jgi:hypothetical protein
VAEVAARLALVEDDPVTAALLLGVAAVQRGAVDHGNPEVQGTYERVRAVLGADAEAAVRRGLELARDEGLAALAAYAGEPAAQVRRW